MTTAASRMPRACPQCRCSLRRVAPHDVEHERARAGMRRFRCRNASCGWEGWLDRPPVPRSKRGARAAVSEQAARARQSRLTTALLVLVSAVVAGAIAWVRQWPAPLFGGECPVPGAFVDQRPPPDSRLAAVARESSCPPTQAGIGAAAGRALPQTLSLHR